MKRRQFVVTAATLALLGGCGVLPNLGQPALPRVARVGILDASAAPDPVPNDEFAGLKQGLVELGLVGGQTIVFESRDADGDLARLPELANELVQLPVDVLVTVSGTAATAAARQATAVLPIVFNEIADPVGKGFVVSLARPGGNLTGVTNAPPTVFGKQFEFLGQLVPGLSRIDFVTNFDPASPGLTPSAVELATSAANALGAQLKFLDVRSADDVEPALTEALAWQTEAMMMFGGPGAVADAVPRLIDFQLQHRIPTAFTNKGEVQAGGLLSYAVSNNGAGRTAAALVDKIIKGARPADLPVEQPTMYELVVNQTTAQALGITVPPEIAQQVTEWVQ